MTNNEDIFDRIERQPTRKIFIIDVKNLPKENAEEYIQKLKTKYMKEDLNNDQFRTL